MWATPDVARAGATSARRRRERRIRSFFRHEQMAIKLAVVSAQHHSSQRCCSVATQTGVEVPATVYAATASPVAACAASAASPMGEYVGPAPVVPAPVFGSVAPAPAVTYAAPAPVDGYVAPTSAVTFSAPAPVIGYVAPAPAVTFSAPAPVFEYVAPAPVFGFAPAPAGSFVAPSQQLRPACTAAAVTTGVNLDADVVGSASQVVGSLPHGGPGFHQVHHELIAAVPAVTEFFPMSDDEGAELSAGLRPAPLWEPLPQERIQRHIVEHITDLVRVAPMVQILDAPLPQTGDQLILSFFGALMPDTEQVIDVPKILLDDVPMRAIDRDTQLGEQLVEVPTNPGYVLAIIARSSLRGDRFPPCWRAFLRLPGGGGAGRTQVRDLVVDIPVVGADAGQYLCAVLSENIDELGYVRVAFDAFNVESQVRGRACRTAEARWRFHRCSSWPRLCSTPSTRCVCHRSVAWE